MKPTFFSASRSMHQAMKPNALNFCRLLRPALLLGAALGVAFGPLPGASAQTGPQPNSPGFPTPYQSPVPHGGGAEDPRQITGTAGQPLFEGRLQGTPTAIVNIGGIPTPVQIPSYLLGAYNPDQGPGSLLGGGAAPIGSYYPDHFADGSYYQWASPFDYISQTAQIVTVDDNDAANFTQTNFNQITTGTAAGLAINQEYYRLPSGTNGTATWTLTATASGSFSVYYQIPDNVPDLTQNPPTTEPRSSSVQYTITTSGANATTTTATVSQTEANSPQFLAGPFSVASGSTITVTLRRTNTINNSTATVLIADAMTLQPTVGDVQSTPTAINTTAFPADFLGFKYWGIYVPGLGQPSTVGTTTLTGQAAVALNAPPDNTGGISGGGATLYHYGDPTKVTTEQNVLAGNGPKARLIRQVVYFGRSEPTAVSRRTIDNAVPAGNGVTDSSATGGLYSTYAAAPLTAAQVAAGSRGNVAASWTVTAPANGNYFVTVHIPTNVVNAGRTAAPDVRVGDASYVVTYPSGNGTVSRLATLSQIGGGDYTLSTGSLPLLVNQTATIQLYNGTQTTTARAVVIADSVTLTTGNQVGAIYCVDGFNGEIIWRFETPASTRGPSAAVFASPVVKHIHVLVPGPANATGPTYADKLVVIVGDNSGLVYCLDAVGNGDGTSNANVIDPNTGQPIYLPQPVYGSTPPVQVDAANYTPHVGTTSAYWIYRPDANFPKKLAQAAGIPDGVADTVPVGAVRRTSATAAAVHLYDRDLPIPGAFSTASPNVFVDPNITDVTQNNAVVYLPNSNGVVYALDALGVPVVTNATGADETGGDRFNNSIDLTTTEGAVPTPTTRWWFTLRGVAGASGTGDSAAAFTSAPALYENAVTVPPDPVTGAPAVTTYLPSVYVGSSSEEGDSSNVGRLYALDGLVGPSGNGGRTHPTTAIPNPTGPVAGPGTPNYNLSQRPQTALADTAHWSFPDAYGTDAYGAGKSSNNLPRPALGDITGSPVVFTNYNGGGENNLARRTRIYFAANSGLEIAPGSGDTVAAARPDDTTTGRVWAVNLDGSVGTTTNTVGVANNSSNVWAYPLANDPNNAAKDSVEEPQLPIGSFLNMTPAMGFVQFPANIDISTGTLYNPADAVRGTLKGASVPMLYVATRGATDTSLYALDIDGDGTQGAPDNNGVTTGKLVYRQPSPDGTIFQSSPALVTNATTTGGNGGAVYVVSGSTLYDFSATPISNAIPNENFPLVRENAAFSGAGPISSPTVAAANVSDLTSTGLPLAFGGANTTDWVYFGDSASGLCRGITPQDSTYGGIPGELGGIVPPTANPLGTVDLSAIPQVYLVDNAHAGSLKAAPGADALPVGAGASLPVYEWGQNVYVRIKNIVPPGTTNYVIDTSLPAAQGQAITAYSNGGAITFQLSDSAPGAVADSATIPPVLLPAPTGANVGQPLGNGFYVRADTPAATTPAEQSSNLVDSKNPNQRYIAAYTYHISDGSERLNTPGSQRRILSVKQTVHVFTSTDGINFTDTGTTAVLSGAVTNGNLISRIDPVTKKYASQFDQVGPVDQPTFGILNPLGVRGGGVPLPLTGNYTAASQIGDALGPFRGVAPLLPANASPFDLEALANGNTVPLTAPASTSGAGTSPITRPAGDLSVNAPNTRTHVVVTSTPLIPHNASGDNSDPTTDTVPPRGTGTTGSGLLTNNFGTVDQPYALDFFDRSALGIAGQTLQIRMSATPNGGAGGGLAWVDNTVLSPSGNTTGHDSVVNYLPWETAPLGVRAGPNTSADYPNISAGNVAATLYSLGGASDLGGSSATPTPATPGATGANSDPVLNRVVHGNPVQVHVTVPNHQPANQQVYLDTTNSSGYNATGETTPYGLNAVQKAYPMGYSSTRRVYVPNTAGRYRRGAAFRTIRIYTGVPVDMRTSIDNGTTDIGRIPSALGVQTDAFNPLGLFAPINRNFDKFFQPVTVRNDGNVNLLNVHLDQKQYYQANGQNAAGAHTLRLTSDALDPLSYILGYDDTGLTGPRANLTGGITQQPYLVRSSLDTDLVNAYGRNPGIVANFGGLYPGATFHKALPGSDNSTTLTVPDAPEDTSTGYSLPLAADNRPVVNANGVPQVAASPYVSIAVPFGTPVGTYSQTVRVFEGLDTVGYQTYNTANTNYNPLYPPKYGGAVGGIGTPGAPPDGIPTDVYKYGKQPVSTTGTVVKGSVIEDRLTDGFTFGALPQIDFGPTVAANANTPAQGVPDLGPAAFRDPQSGRLSLYWTSSRNLSNGGSPYDIFGYNVNYAAPAFLTANGGQSWWSPIMGGGGTPGKLFPDASGAPTHSGLTIAQTGNTVYAFDVVVNNLPTYTNQLFAYPVNAQTGMIGSRLLLTRDDSQVKYGVKGLLTGSTNFAFWTAATRGRTAIYYTTYSTGQANPATAFVLPVPAGLTAVADPTPVLMPVGNRSQVEVTFSGTAPDGSVNLYNCRYNFGTTNAGQLDLASFVAVREIMAPVGGGYQARDVAWDRTGQLNLFAVNPNIAPGQPGYETPLLYDINSKPLFKRAIVDKASGQLVLTGITVPVLLPNGAAIPSTVYIDGASGRVRFSPALPPTSAAYPYQIEGLFVPQAKRITGTGSDRRADTGPVSFLDQTLKPNDSPNLNPVTADRRWYIWRKSSAGQGGAATLFYKTQRLTMYLPTPVDTTKPIKINGIATTTVDVQNIFAEPQQSARIYLPISSGLDGQQATVEYTPIGGANQPPVIDVVQWLDERNSSDTSTPPANSTQALQSAEGTAVPISQPVNENNVAAFLDPYAGTQDSTGALQAHKVWLFWNSTRNGTSDLYMETIDPRFGP